MYINSECMLILVGGYFFLFNGVVRDFIRRKTLLRIQKHGTDLKSHENGSKKAKPSGKQGVNDATVKCNNHTKYLFTQLLHFKNLQLEIQVHKVYIFDTITDTSMIFMYKSDILSCRILT